MSNYPTSIVPCYFPIRGGVLFLLCLDLEKSPLEFELVRQQKWKGTYSDRRGPSTEGLILRPCLVAPVNFLKWNLFIFEVLNID